MFKHIILSTVLLFFYFFSYAQSTDYPQDYFRSPVDFPIVLSGNFGELRSNHFHAGLDIKTQGVEGQKLFAAAEGYISRIKVSPWGYGKAIYIDHPNGFTTVYAHMQKFNDEINTYVKAQQMQSQNYSVDLYPAKDFLKVEKGTIIGLSGNTGGSAGAHLHFEIRDTKTETPLNPMLFGFTVQDNIAPIIYSLGFYPINDGLVLNKRERYYLKMNRVGTGVYGANIEKLTAFGSIGVGIKVNDMANMAHNKLGAYKIRLFVNDTIVYSYTMNAVSFDESRFINSHIDYAYKQMMNAQYEKCFLDPGNELSIYDKVVDRGILNIEDGKYYQLRFEVEDFNGNISKANFGIQGKENIDEVPYFSSNKIIGKVDRKKPFEFNSEKVSFSFEPYSFYDDFNFEFWMSDTFPRAIAPNYYIHKALEPVHKNYQFAIDLKDIDTKLKEKIYPVRYDNKGKESTENFEIKEDKIILHPKALGAFTLKTDFQPPKIMPVNFHNQKRISGTKNIKFTAIDIASGIKSQDAYLNGNWVLFENEPKQNLYTYQVDEFLQKGENTLEIIVRDYVGNEAKEVFTLYY